MQFWPELHSIAEKGQLMVAEQVEQYNKTAQDWVRLSERTQKTLADMTKYFPLGAGSDSAKPITEEQFTRSLTRAKQIPSKAPVIINVLRVLAVFYGLGIINRDRIEDFLSDYDLRPPKGSRLDECWAKIEEGKAALSDAIAAGAYAGPEAKEEAEEELEEDEAEEKPWDWRLITRIAIPLVLLLIIIAIAKKPWQVRDGNPQILIAETSTISMVPAEYAKVDEPIGSESEMEAEPIRCGESYERAEPIFYASQGFSLYTPLGSGSSLLSSKIRSVAIGPDNRGLVWVGYTADTKEIDGVSVNDRSTWVHHCLDGKLRVGEVTNDVKFHDDLTYFAFDNRGIGVFNDSKWAFYNSDQGGGLHSDDIYSLWVDGESIFAATGAGVFRLHQGKWVATFLAAPNKLINNSVHVFLIDQAGNSWFGTTNSGISRLHPDGQQWTTYFQDDIFLKGIRRAVEDKEGGVWFATNKGGLLRFQNEQWSVFNMTEGALPDDQVHDVGRDVYGRIWAATQGGLAYTPDLGETWIWHSTIPVFDLAFGCSKCEIYNEDHMWLVWRDRGLGHVRIPPPNPTIEIVSVTPRKQLRPGESFVFEVTVRVVAEQLTPDDGDSLRATVPPDLERSALYGAWQTIAVPTFFQVGDTYTFSNTQDPIIAPAIPGTYRIPWRVWQGKRFVTEPVYVEFEVVDQ